MRRGFTLIEMLVVVALIVLLAGILLPVIAAANAQARRTTCLSNLRQLGTAWQLYADDHDGTYFWQRQWDFDEEFQYRGQFYRTHIRWPFVIGRYLKTPEITKCPEDTAPKEWRTVGPWWLSYGPNLHLAMGYPEGVGGAPASEAAIENPSGVIALAESLTGFGCCEPWNSAYFRSADYWGQFPFNDWYEFRKKADGAHSLAVTDAEMEGYCRHGMGNHAVFLDGHVKWLRWNAVGDADSAEWKAMLGVRQ